MLGRQFEAELTDVLMNPVAARIATLLEMAKTDRNFIFPPILYTNFANNTSLLRSSDVCRQLTKSRLNQSPHAN